MSCYHPLKGYRTPTGVVFSELSRHDILGDIELPCGQCIGCRMRRASDWTLRCQHESSLWEQNCFITLTYARDCLPPDGSLCHRDFVLFMKRFRKRMRYGPIRFYMCGEYGPLNLRPHYHACIFNADFKRDSVSGKSGAGAVFFHSDLLFELWGHGRVSVQDLTRETAGYCARYIMKKQLGDPLAYANADGVLLKPEYSVMSKGVGRGWFEKFKRDVFPHDFVIGDGLKHQVPRFYDKLYKRLGVDTGEIELARYKKAQLVVGDQSDDRRRVREIVHTARVRNLLRGDLE